MSFSSHSRETIDDAWRNAEPIPGIDAELWRQDQYGAWMHKNDYANRHSQYGWEVCDGLGCCRSLQALQWQNFKDYCQMWDGSGDSDRGGTGSLF